MLHTLRSWLLPGPDRPRQIGCFPRLLLAPEIMNDEKGIMRNLNLRSKPNISSIASSWEGCLWGNLRLLIVLVILIALVYIGKLGFEQVDRPTGILRYLFLPLATLIGAILFGARYIQDTYRLPRFWPALQYLLSALFAINYPSITASKAVSGERR